MRPADGALRRLLSTVSHVPRLLLIEDDAAIRTSLTRSLSERGHAVASAPTAMAGLQAVVDTAPDLVVLDLGLPDLDGGKLIQMVRAVSKVPIIVITMAIAPGTRKNRLASSGLNQNR